MRPAAQRVRAGVRFGVAIGLAGLCAHADAHAPFKGAGVLYSGLLHPLTSLDEILPIIAFALLAGQQLYAHRSEWMTGAFLVAFVAGATCAWWMPGVQAVPLLNLAASVMLGVLVLVAWSPPAAISYVLAVGFGMSLGYASGLSPADGLPVLPFTLGLATGITLVVGYVSMAAFHALSRQRGWLTVAVRVAGSWIAAVGILVLANSLRHTP